MNLQSDDFELFGLERQFALDRASLDTRWKDLQRQAHPDKFSAQGAAAQRIAMQWSVRINEAYQRLKDPMARAAYLCELHGAPIEAHSNTAMPVDFLMHQVEWHEALDDAASVNDLDSLSLQVQSTRQQLLQQCEDTLDLRPDYPAAVASVRALMFIEKFSRDLNQRFEQFE